MVVPTLGTSPYLAAAVRSALAERPAEVLVVANGAANPPADDVAGARVLRLDEPNRSLARNAGVHAARTPLVAFLDDDDESLPGRLERQATVLDAFPDAPLCFGAVRVVDGAGRPLPRWNALLARRFAELARLGATYEAILATQCPIYTSATLVRREPFLAAGGFDVRFSAYEDLDLYLRLARRGTPVAAPGASEPVTLYRLHGANTPSDELYLGMLLVTEKHLPDTRGRARRLLLERRLDALWGLGRFADTRREGLHAAADDPRLLARPRVVKRLAAALVPRRILERRR